MERLVTRLLLACLPAILPTVAFAEDHLDAGAADIIISTGIEGGGYWSAGARLQDVSGRVGLSVENQASQGSLDNLEKLLDGDSPVNLAFAQADALQHYLNKNPDSEGRVELLENIGQECVFIVTDVGSELYTGKDLQTATDLRLGIASESSGIAVTYEYMVSQVPELANVEVVYGDTSASMGSMGGPDARLDAIMVVHRPRELSAEVEEALSNPGRFRFLELSDERLTRELPNGTTVYRSMNLAMPGPNEPVKTICVRGLLLANKQKLTAQQRDQLTDLVSYHWMEVYATP